jgi:hypothetical protein
MAAITLALMLAGCAGPSAMPTQSTAAHQQKVLVAEVAWRAQTAILAYKARPLCTTPRTVLTCKIDAAMAELRKINRAAVTGLDRDEARIHAGPDRGQGDRHHRRGWRPGHHRRLRQVGTANRNRSGGAMDILAILAEAMSLIKPGVEFTPSLYDIFERGRQIATGPTPATDGELAAFKQQITDEKARRDANTAEIEKD